MTRFLTSAGVLLTLVLSTLDTPAALAQTGQTYLKTNPRIMEAVTTVVAKPSESTVRVLSAGKEAALGTVVDAEGFILTKHSVLEGNDISVRLKDGKDLKATLVGVKKDYDLALLKVDVKGLKPIEWRKDGPVPGDMVLTPGPTEKVLYMGVVSVAARKTSARDFPVSLAPPAGSGFLGVQLDAVDGKVIIKEVTKDSAAEKAGLKNDDYILAINGKAIKDVPGMIAIVSGKKAGEKITLKIERESKEMDVEATLAKRPVQGANRGDFQNNLGSELSKVRSGFPSVLQHDTVVKPTDCGGPLVDLEGRAVGVNIARAGRVESYAVPVDAIQALLPDLKSGKLPPPKE